MMKRDIDVIVVRGEFFRATPKDESGEKGRVGTPAYNRNIMVQEYSGNMLFLQSDGGSLLNLQKEGEPFDLTEYIAKYVTEDTLSSKLPEDIVSDSNYVHTDNNFTNTLK